MILTTEVNGCFLYLLPRKRSEAKLVVKRQIRIGDFDHQSSLDDTDVLILDIIDTETHPDYNDDTAYFDVGILKTALFELNEVQETLFSHEMIEPVSSIIYLALTSLAYQVLLSIHNVGVRQP